MGRDEKGGGMRDVIDAHVHLRLLYKYNPERIDWLIAHRCAVISWAFGGDISCTSDLEQYFRARLIVFEELRGRGLTCYHLCGIHPRKIPPDLGPEDVGGMLAPFMDDPYCLGIGEIGLETGTSREQEILCAQLEYGLSLERPDIRFGIHTPRHRKEAVVGQLFRVLAPYETSLAPVAVIDHCTSETIEDVLSRGYHAGISLSATKSSESDLLRIMARFSGESHRIMCNTDSSRDFYEDLILSSRGGGLAPKVSENIFFSTALRFFKI